MTLSVETDALNGLIEMLLKRNETYAATWLMALCLLNR